MCTKKEKDKQNIEPRTGFM